MEDYEPRRLSLRLAPRVMALAAVLLAVFVAWKVIDLRAAPKAAPRPAVAAQAAAPPQPAFAPPEAVLIKVARGETLEAAILRLGIPAVEARQVVDVLGQAMDTVHIEAGLALEAAVARPRAPQGSVRLVGLSLRTGPASALTLSRTFDGALSLRQLDEKIRDDTVAADGAIEGSLYETAEKLGATPAITAQVMKLFSHKLDFQRDIQPGDRFKLVFDRKVTESGRTISAGDLEYAELHGVKFYRFERGRNVEYFDETGKNIKGFLLKTPVDGARITSLFGLRRHPVLGYTRAHEGIDFGAGVGTPILAAGDGVVLEARRWGGYGNWLRIRHTAGWDTGYGHISRYAPGIRPGVHVRQGQVVAYVGATGLATGPHLHYEIWRNGARVNPLSTRVPQGSVLAGAELARFRAAKARIDGLLAAPRTTAVADSGGGPIRR
ncbi:M23 family metallopeptidase [Phenylobacterium soli]|uniref:M23 family peptidase n=1 Tax=Phenylobacterium soli TaxID=2170551 RepID=A0A328AJJ4_9CAUL|nr:M23 family metallopeptidase [Phenylobacterium soli]RAK54595.1 M23 family peptidase [Phenylobacterium soli]